MCSTRCDRPASGSSSAAEPVPIQKPERDGSHGVHALRDDPHARVELGQAVLRRASATRARGRARAAAVPRAARAARRRARSRGRRRAAAVAPRSPRSRRARAAAVAAAACRRPRAPRRTCRRSPGPRPGAGRCGRARGRPRPRGRWISSPLLRTSSTVVDALAGRDVGDVQQAVGALGELDEGAERRRLDDLAGELVADLDLLGHRPDALGQRLAQLAVGRVDEDLALVVDVDLRLELVGEAADRLAALADEQADLVRVDLDRDDARRVRRELLARRVDDLAPSGRGCPAAPPGLGERVAQDVERHARDLDVHLEGGDALARCRRP